MIRNAKDSAKDSHLQGIGAVAEPAAPGVGAVARSLEWHRLSPRWRTPSQGMGALLLVGLTLLGVASPARADDSPPPTLIDFAPALHLHGHLNDHSSATGFSSLQLQPDSDQDLTASVDIDASAGRFGTNIFTVSHWFATQFSEPGRHADVIGNRTSVGHGNFFSVRISGEGIISLELDQDGNGTNYASAIAPQQPVNDGRWHHLSYVRGSDLMGIFIDGHLVALTAATPARIDGTNPLRIGRGIGPFANFSSIAASYDDVRVYPRVLTLSEITQLASVSHRVGDVVLPE